MSADPVDCAFCDAVNGNGKTETVAQSEDWVAFFPLGPATLGHTLVVPRLHVSDYWSAPSTIVSALSRACLDVGRAIQRAVSSEGMNLITSQGAVAEQTVFHLHIHLLPRWSDDEFGSIWPAESMVDSGRQAWAADRIRAECAGEPPGMG
ncbi:HIT family protein [Kribbella sp. CA-253562]|uniref:HIT family protein n=1 Tax=Kribbella sp. CA-253562 TaxID=3239942 RepID=UPI003D8FEDC1